MQHIDLRDNAINVTVFYAQLCMGWLSIQKYKLLYKMPLKLFELYTFRKRDMAVIIIHQIFSLSRDWSKHVT